MCGALLLISACSESDKLTLSSGGKAEYSIVLPDAPTLVETTAARELKKHLDEITGADFAIVGESKADSSKPLLIVGNSSLVKAFLPAVDVTQLPYDGIVIETIGKNIVMVGHPVRGTLYAVNTFLEEAAGVRWWTSTESYIPKAKRLKVPMLHINYAPHLIYREAFYKEALSNEVFAARMKCNGDFSKITPQYGDYHKFQYFVHSFYPILPPQKYFDKHPEWYSLVNGKRTNQWAQLCLSNDAMREEFIRNAIDTLRNHRGMDFISISQNDCHGACQCEKCQAIVKEEGSESGPLIRFVNSVAEEIEKEFPDIWVETLAYQYTRKAPQKVKPRRNVVVRLCTIECSFSQSLDEGEHNKSFREDIEAWSKIADHLFVWDYVTNFTSYMLPHPNIHTLASNIRFFIKNNTIGLFEQGDVYCDAGDFVRMRNWVISRLMWNPGLDENQLIDEFLTGYYGEKAAPYLRQYWDLLTNRIKESEVYLRCYMKNTADWLTVPVYAEAALLMKQALDVTKDETLRNRIHREEIPLKFVLLLENERFKAYEKENGSSPVTLPDPETALTEFMALLKEFNVTIIREDFSPNANHIQWVEQLLRSKLFPEDKQD
ncbi:DUF4838 domain-containing protein [uncultured Proteiniphilum sp.]|uniref:DUF4838 domain-containing protein n=1 Tax=uncultured Proteiniphilum sp. TaxID=497637 RepID=UPI00263351C3|nr:DUF4838 domain-containing protein [uncultured Proteiniphilum sp.]